MADDAGALLVRSGLVPSSALDAARARAVDAGGTLGEHLVLAGAITDDALTEFYRARLLVPQVNPNTLARLPAKLIAMIPADMAIEHRVIPVAHDAENNLTVAMSDPADRDAANEVAFFTNAYVVRAVATQMQIAWCLAHYYGHVTPLGERLLHPSGTPSGPAYRSEPRRLRGVTDQVAALRRRAIAPDVETAPKRTTKADDKTKNDEREAIENAITDRETNTALVAIGPQESDTSIASGTTPREVSIENAITPREVSIESVITPREGTARGSQPKLPRAASIGRPGSEPTEPAAPDQASSRARSVSGEIRIPIRRAPSIKPAMPEPLLADGEEDDTPEISVEPTALPDEDPTGPRKLPPRRRVVKPDPPELAARAGEVTVDTGRVPRIADEEPAVVIAEDLAAPVAANDGISGELIVVAKPNDTSPPASTIEVAEESSGVVMATVPDESAPILLDRRRPPSDGMPVANPDLVVVELKKKAKVPRTDKITKVGVGPVPARVNPAFAIPGVTIIGLDDEDTTGVRGARAPNADYPDDLAPPPQPAPPVLPDREVAAVPELDDDGEYNTAVMSAAELDAAIPQRTAEVVPGHLAHHATEGEVDDGWGPPGTTIPPPLLGAIPDSESSDVPSAIPMPNMDSAPLQVVSGGTPQPITGPGSGSMPNKVFELATARLIELIRALEHARSRDDVVDVMIDHLAETHQRVGFFSIKSGELGVFSLEPRPVQLPTVTLRIDEPSTLHDVIAARIPFRGPMRDDKSKQFLASVLGACPSEILLVTITVRERPVGVVFGENRIQQTFDDQLALAARAAGMALERILKSKRS
ncbi:MAG: hypothetical protein AB7O24_10530 [Kofleriaceae bacterium]